MNRDWKGNANAVFKTLGASNHSLSEREERDFYATDPASVRALMDEEDFCRHIWEPACGLGHISKTIMEDNRYWVYESDIVQRIPCSRLDFLSYRGPHRECDIITNPPYSKAFEFVVKALDVVTAGHKVAMLLRIQFLEGLERRKLFDLYPPHSGVCVHQETGVCKEWRFSQVRKRQRAMFRMVRMAEGI